MIVIDICLSDIPKEMITRAKNGKAYCKMIVAGRKEPDKYGNDHTVFMSTPKEDKGKPKVYVGSGKTIPVKNDSVQQAESGLKNFSEITNGDLPF